jgi:GTP-binding protein SAR1
MFILNFFKDLLGYLGIYKKDAKILFLGLDNAGKTTLLRRLKDDRMVQHDPTLYAHAEELTLGNVRFKAYDLGGHQAARKAWKNYFPKVDGIIYLVDAADKGRFVESRKELDGILSTVELAKVPVVILGNKIDKKEAASEEELRLALGVAVQTNFGLQKINDLDGRPVEVFMCSVAKKMGYAEGFRWLGGLLK